MMAFVHDGAVSLPACRPNSPPYSTSHPTLLASNPNDLALPRDLPTGPTKLLPRLRCTLAMSSWPAK